MTAPRPAPGSWGGLRARDSRLLQPDAWIAEPAPQDGAVLAYGNFITIAVNFIIIAFVLFLVVKAINRLQHKQKEEPKAPAAPPEDVVLLGEIRDLLKQKGA